MLDSYKMSLQYKYMLEKLPGTFAFIVSLTIIPFTFLALYTYQLCFGNRGASLNIHYLYWTISLIWVNLPSLLFSIFFIYIYIKNNNAIPIWDLSLGVLALMFLIANVLFTTLLLNFKVGTIL